MSVRPVEYIIIGFPGNQFTGEIVPALADLVESGLIRIIDLVIVTKDADGELTVVDLDADGDVAIFHTLDGEVGGYIGPEDIDHAGSDLEPGWTAALLIWEDRWAEPLATAIGNAGGFVIEGGRIPQELIAEAETTASPAS